MTENGTKHDGTKPAIALVPPEGLRLLAEAMTYGARKYGQYNYLGGIAYTRLLSATMRHILAYLEGHDLDSESGLSHIGHAMAGLAMLAQMTKVHPELDDRYKPEVATEPVRFTHLASAP